jgi:two-component system response regulator
MNQSESGRVADILLADDNEDDIELMRIGLRRARFAMHLHAVHDGEECMAFLRRQGRFADAPTPDLLLLDLNMPRMDGREVLAAISQDETLRHLPVIVLTTSTIREDVLTAYRLSCSSYIVKPIDFQQFVAVVQAIVDYWFSVVVLPDVRHPPSLRIKDWAPAGAGAGERRAAPPA